MGDGEMSVRAEACDCLMQLEEAPRAELAESLGADAAQALSSEALEAVAKLEDSDRDVRHMAVATLDKLKLWRGR